MKLFPQIPIQRRGERGFFLTIVLLIIASIMLIYVAANGRRLVLLNKEIRRIEAKQIQRLNHLSGLTSTNPPIAIIPTAAAK